jgi:DNA-binding transcriptional ArsR family regulator
MLNSRAYKAIAHPIRRDILKRLRTGPLSAGVLAAQYNISKPSLSAHFSALKEADLIFAKRDGNHIYYNLNLTVANEVLAALMDIFGITQGSYRAENPTTESNAYESSPKQTGPV